MTHNFSTPSSQEIILKSILNHSTKNKTWPSKIRLHPAHVPYANLFLSMSGVKAVADSAVSQTEAVTE